MYLASLGYDFQMCHVLLNVGLVLMFLDVVRWFFFVYNHLVQGPGVWDLSIFYSFPTTCFILFPFVSLHPYPVWRPRVPGLPPANLRNFQSFPGAWMRDSVQHSAWAFQNGIPTSEQMDSHSLGTYLYYIREPWMWRMMDWSDPIKNQRCDEIFHQAELFHGQKDSTHMLGQLWLHRVETKRPGYPKQQEPLAKKKDATLGDSNI